MPFVHQIAARVLRRVPPSVLREDLVSAGSVGLLDALRKIVGRGPEFEGYARIRIHGAILDELRSLDWLPRRMRARTEGSVVMRFGDLPEYMVLSFADEEASPYEQVEESHRRARMQCAVAHLPKREASIVRWHYFEGLHFRVIATRLGISQPRVSQLHMRALGRLRVELAGESDAASRTPEVDLPSTQIQSNL